MILTGMMKRICWIAALMLLGMQWAGAQSKVKWYSIEEAIELTTREPRVLMIDVYTDWCGWCKRMDATTFSDPSIVSMLNEHFYPVKLDAEGKEDIVIGNRTYKFVESGRSGYHEVAAIITKGRLSYPTISYVDEKGRVLEAYPGYKTPDQLRVYLSFYSDGSYKTTSFEEFAGSFRD
jgi:thioredoxin-related protein